MIYGKIKQEMKQKIGQFLKRPKIIAGAILLVGVFVFLTFVTRASQQKDAFDTTKSDPALQSKTLDSDHDGLPDWEEELIGTDPHNPDTDGDGFKDGEEVASGHDPLVKGPNDKVADIKMNKAIGEKLQEPKNLTEAIVDNAAQISLNPNAPADPTQLVDSIQNSTGKDFLTDATRKHLLLILMDFMPPKIKSEDLPVSQDNSKESLHQYIEDFSKVFSSPKNKIDLTDEQVILLAVQQNQPFYASQLSQNWLDAYKRGKEIKVPSTLLQIHLAGLESFYTLGKGYGALQDASTDPAKSAIALKEIEMGQEMILAAYNQLALVSATF